MRIELSKPIRAHGEERTFLDLREPRPADVWDLSLQIGGSALTLVYGQILTFAGRLAAIPPSALQDLAAEDCGRLVEAALPFLAPFLGGGRPVSAN